MSKDESGAQSTVDRAKLHEQSLQMLYLAIGQGIAHWSRLEHALSVGFAAASGLPLDRAAGLFFSISSFEGKVRLLKRALADGEPKGSSLRRKEIISLGLKRADQYKIVRNHLAHHRPLNAHIGAIGPVGVLVPNDMHKLMKQKSVDHVLTIKSIIEASASFSKLADLIQNSCQEDNLTSLNKIFDELELMPNQPCARSFFAIANDDPGLLDTPK